MLTQRSRRILCLVSLGFFFGSFVSLGNLIDVLAIEIILLVIWGNSNGSSN